MPLKTGYDLAAEIARDARESVAKWEYDMNYIRHLPRGARGAEVTERGNSRERWRNRGHSMRS
jgi:hypothetical protein